MKRLYLLLCCVWLTSCASQPTKFEPRLTDTECFIILNFDSNVVPFRQNVHYIDFGPGTPSLLGLPAYELVKPGLNIFKVSDYKLYLSIIFNHYGSIQWPDKTKAIVITPAKQSIVYAGDIYADVHYCGDKRCVSYRIRDNEAVTVSAARSQNVDIFQNYNYRKIIAKLMNE